MPNRHVGLLLLCFALPTTPLYAQGQDSSTWERDLQVIMQLLPGGYSNANQSYFDRRTKAAVQHGALRIRIESLTNSALGPAVFRVTGHYDADQTSALPTQLWQLSADDEQRAVRMRRWRWRDGDVDPSAELLGQFSCDLHWYREAQQFRARQLGDCEGPFADSIVLGPQQLWLNQPHRERGDYQLHRARPFECYADIPGVGGGRDEPYDRYDGLKLDDQGGSAWFTSKEGRRLGVSLLLVDWPINNYDGVFTRDSLVVYVSEQLAEERQELGYAFTEPTAERVGINLKWMLVNCFMVSNEFATPEM